MRLAISAWLAVLVFQRTAKIRFYSFLFVFVRLCSSLFVFITKRYFEYRPMRNINELLTQYAAYHRDQRNIMTHFVGVPMIVFSAILAIAQINLGLIHAGWITVLLASLYYVWLDRILGAAMFIFLFICGVMASFISIKTGSGLALILALVIFVAGWVMQFIGHKYEGVKPAFVDDMMSLLVGPIFVMAEFFFLLGAKKSLRHDIEARVGPTMPQRNGRLIAPLSAPLGPQSSNNANKPTTASN
jgi:uncharacterized membrane protein YGL010W